MANAEVDIAKLSESQQLALGTYTAVTNQDTAAAIALLQRSEWNVQIAIAKFFDGEAPDPIAEARTSQASATAPLEQRHREVLQNGFNRPPRSSFLSRRDPAPRIVPQQGGQLYRPPFILAILFAPFSLVYRLLSGTFSFLGTLLPFRRIFTDIGLIRHQQSKPSTVGREPLTPQGTAARFAREFEEQYGSHNLRFEQTSYAQAYDTAKKELKFLIVLLLSPQDDDTEAFVKGTLLSETVVNYINDPQSNAIIWAGTVQDSEAYQVSNALRCSKFPFTALISHTPQDDSTSMSVLARISGLTSASTFVARLRAAIAQQAPAIEQVRATRHEQQASRSLRNEQNSAYERSLARDRERTRQRREAEAAKLRAEQEEKAALEAESRKQHNITRWRSWRARSLAPEPSAASKDVSRVSIRLTSGERVIRNFNGRASLEELYAFVECYDVLQSGDTSEGPQPKGYEHEFGFRLVSPMPRTVYDVQDTRSIGDSLGRNGSLIVESMGEEDDED